MKSDAAVALGELLDRVIDHRGRTPKKLGGDFVSAGVPVISAKNIKNSRLDLGGEVRYVTSEMWETWMPIKLARGDVLLTSEAPLGEVAYLQDDSEYCLGQRLFALRTNPEKLCARFLFYALRSPKLRHRLLARASGTTAQGIRQAELVKVEVDAPPVDEQRRIAWVLGSLDDKIENNRRIANTLEQVAATIFKAWFVDLVDHDDLVASEIGRIPRGWSVGTLADVASPYKKLEKGPTDLPYIGLDAMPRGSTVLASWGSADVAPQGQSAMFEPGDILFGKLRPYFRKVGVAPIQGRCSTEILVLRPIEPAFYGFLLGHVSSQRFIDHCVAVSRGTKMPRAEWGDASTFRVALPPNGEVSSFNDLARASYLQIRALTIESRNLGQIRDRLLSRLMSGALRVPEDDSVLAEAA